MNKCDKCAHLKIVTVFDDKGADGEKLCLEHLNEWFDKRIQK